MAQVSEYAITQMPNDSNLLLVHKHVGGNGYICVFSGTHNEVIQFLRGNNITDLATKIHNNTL